MTQIKFNDLPLCDKALLMAEYGTYLESVQHEYWIHLYELHGHFVEVFYNTKTRQIDKISMPSYQELDKYMGRIVLK